MEGTKVTEFEDNAEMLGLHVHVVLQDKLKGMKGFY